jgi:MYXO-CTERM domain-containing protein
MTSSSLVLAGTWNNSAQLNSSGGSLTLGGSWGNTGAIFVSGGGTLTLAGASGNVGSVTVNDSLVRITGSYTTPQLLSLNLTNSSVSLVGGTIVNTGSTLPVSAASGLLTLAGGTISGGTISSTDSRTLDAIGGTTTLSNAILNVSTNVAGTATLSLTGTVTFASGTVINQGTLRVGTATLGKLDATLSNMGTVDLGGSMILGYTDESPLSSVRSQIVTGFAHGTWNGPGIRSSRAVGNPHAAIGYAEASALGVTTFAGQSVDTTTLLLRYTVWGDANLDGTVTTSDFTALASHFGSPTQAWSDGDFNYDGVVNAIDFNMLASNFGQTLLASPDLGTVVPEPSAALLALVAIGAGRRRRYS